MNISDKDRTAAMALRCCTAIVALSIGMTAPAQAEEVPPSASDDATIVVTARKRSESLQNVPDAISVLNQKQLVELGVTDVSGLRQIVSNFDVQQTQQPGTAFINIRGVTMQRFQEPSVAVVIDGVQLVSQYQILQALEDVNQIEVLRGPQGSLYGRNAIGGAINVTTDQPTNELRGSASASYAEGKTYQFRGRLAGAIMPDKLLFDVAASYGDSKGLLSNTFLGGHADFERLANVRGKLKLTLGETVTLDLRGSYEDRKGGVGYFINIPSGDINDTHREVESGTRGIGQRKLTDLSAKLNWEGPGFEVSSTTAYAKVNDDFFQDIDYTPPALLDVTQLVDVKAISQELRVTSNRGGRFRWLFGGYFADIDQDVSTVLYIAPCVVVAGTPCSLGPVDRATDIEVPFGINRNNNKTFAFFSQVNYDLTTALELTFGLRYDKDRRTQFSLTENLTRKDSFSALQPKFSAAYKWSSDAMTYATVSRGFRSGAFNGTDYVTRRYGAESLMNYEVGSKLRLFDRAANLNIAAFYMDYHNRQEYVIAPGTGAQSLFNVPRSRIFGFELDGSARLGGGLSATFAFGFLDSKITRSSSAIVAAFGQSFVGNRLPRVARTSASAGLRHETALTDQLDLVTRVDWTMHAGQHWSLGNVNDKEEPIHLVNARIVLDYRKSMKLEVFATNLFNRRYYAEGLIPGFGSINAAPSGFPAKPRQIGGRVSYAF